MVRRSLAMRSLRHLRFAHRVMVSQPLLARASGHLPAYIPLDGYQLPVGRILRHIPQGDPAWIADSAPPDMPASAIASPAEPPLRLLPRLPGVETPADANATDVAAELATWQAQPPISASEPPRALPSVEGVPVAPPAPAPTPARADGLRPHSRIVELPGVVSLPIEESANDAAMTPDIPADTQAEDTDEPEQPPPQREAGAATPISSVEPAPMIAEEAPPAPALRRRGKRATATPPRASDALFPPTDDDRSPATWLARLQQTGKPTPQPATPTTPARPPDDEPPATPNSLPGKRGNRKGSGATRASATPTLSTTPTSPATPKSAEERPATLADSSRVLLHTLTGVDPASVRMYRGPVAERVTSAQNADALTDGGAIALGGGHATDTPETLGLLAHELTHVAQRRSPRFVPPVSLSLSHTSRDQRQAHAMPPTASAPPSASSPADEESQATEVEARVTHIARIVRARATSPGASVVQPTFPVDSATTPQPPQADARPTWGNLPAPWEPLPDWMAAPAESPVSAPPAAAQPSGRAMPQAQSSAPAPARPTASDAPGTQRAERGRALPADTEASHVAQAYEGGAPEPDLDALAQQVHAILKRRLAAERRRFG